MADANDYFIYIIIPTYNREKLIRRALDSVICQSFKNWKAIVVDDGSMDGTKLVVSEYLEKNKDKIIYKYKNNGGSGSARNLGIETVLAENPSDNALISFLDSDDELLPEAFEFAINKIKEYPEIISFAFSGKDNFGKRWTFMSKGEMIMGFDQIITEKNVKNDTLHFFYAHIFKDNSFRFDERFNGGEATLFWNIYKKYKTLFSSKILWIYYVDANDSITRSMLTLSRIEDFRRKNEVAIVEFQDDLRKYNKIFLGKQYLACARMNALLGNKGGSFSYFIKGIKYSPLDFKRILLYSISLFDKNLVINNLLIRFSNTIQKII